MARKKSLPEVGSPKVGAPAALFTRENARPLAAELGAYDEETFDEFLERLTTVASWCEVMFELSNNNTARPFVRKKLGLLQSHARELLQQIDGLDRLTRDALTTGFRNCRRPGDPRVRHIDARLVTGAGLTIGVIRGLVALLHEAARRAAELTPRGDGRPTRTALNQTVLSLAEVYEDFSGRKFTTAGSPDARAPRQRR